MKSFKEQLAKQTRLRGLWQSLGMAYTAEICARAGFDWLLFDGEHAPNTVPSLLAQLQAVAPFAATPIARPPHDDPALIKQYMDIGFVNLMIPMVESAQQALQVVAATRFPPRGIRGVASGVSRASAFGADADYLQKAHENVTVIVQIESQKAVDAIDEIAAVPGVDALFIGTADLSAALGHLGNPHHPDVEKAILLVLEHSQKAGKPVGIFPFSTVEAEKRFEQGFSFAPLGTDIGLLTAGAKALLAS